MESLSSFFEMGGYAVFIWPSYLVTALVLTTLFVTTLRFLRSNEAELKELQGQGQPSARPNAADREVGSEA
jgi:heme exporter protein D